MKTGERNPERRVVETWGLSYDQDAHLRRGIFAKVGEVN